MAACFFQLLKVPKLLPASLNTMDSRLRPVRNCVRKDRQSAFKGSRASVRTLVMNIECGVD